MSKLILALCISAVLSSMECGNNAERNPLLYFSSPQHRRLESADSTRESEFAPLRISYEFYEFSLGTTEADNFFMNTVLPSVSSFFESVLLTKQLKSGINLTLTRPAHLDPIEDFKCGTEVIIPAAHQAQGIPNTDIVIYLTTQELPAGESTAAFAGACVLEDSSMGYVLAGRVVFNTRKFPNFTFNEQFLTTAHEITHVLGFVYENFKYFNRPEGGKYQTAAGLLSEDLVAEEDIRGVTKKLFKGPTVAALAREFFACDSLVGLELETQGGSGTVDSHWDMRVVYNDYMIGTVSDDVIYSKFTFALLKDSGWYDVRWEYTETPVFGQNKGCEFHTQKCIENDLPQFDEFCVETQETCDVFHLHKAFCNLAKLPVGTDPAYSYFSDPTKGGQEKLIDYCPVRVGRADGNCRDSSEATYVESVFGETACDNCRCLAGTLIQQSYSVNGDPHHSGCYELLSCETEFAVIRVGNTNTGYTDVECPFTGGQVTVQGFDGFLECPNSDVLCGNLPCINSCYGMGKCVKGHCVCDAGRGGVDCSIEDGADNGGSTPDSGTDNGGSTPDSGGTTVATPIASISAPRSFILTCSTEELTLSGSLSTVLPSVLYRWEVSALSLSAELESHVKSQTSSTLIVPDTLLSVGTLIFTLTITDEDTSLTYTANHIAAITKDTSFQVAVDPAPAVELEISSKRLFTATAINLCDYDGSVYYEWNYKGTTEGAPVLDSQLILRRTYRDSNMLFIVDGDLEIGYTYIFEVTAMTTENIASADLYVTAAPSELRPIISHLDGAISNSADLVLDGSQSYDPDDSSASLVYSWTCTSGGSECLDSEMNPIIIDNSVPIMTIPKENLQTGRELIFILIVSDATRNSEGSVTLMVSDLPVDEIEKPTPLYRINHQRWFNLPEQLTDIGSSLLWYEVLGESINPYTDTKSPFLGFPADEMSEGSYYAWEVQYKTTTNEDIRNVYSWTTNEGPKCGEDTVTVNKMSDSRRPKYSIEITGCTDGDEQDYPLLYSLAFMIYGRMYSLLPLSEKNNLVIRLPSGEYPFFIHVCDQMMTCLKVETEVSIRRMLRAATEGEIELDFNEDITDTKMIPSSVYYFASEEELTEDLWDYMFSVLEQFVLEQPEYSESLVESSILAVTQLIKQGVVDSSRILQSIDLIRSIFEASTKLSSKTIELVLLAFDEIILEFIDNLQFIEMSGKTFHYAMKRYMEETPHSNTSIELSSEAIDIYSEQVSAAGIRGKQIKVKGHRIIIPNDLSFESSDIVDIFVMVINRSEYPDIVQVTVSKSGHVSSAKLEEVGTQIHIEFPCSGSKQQWDCAYLQDNVWSKGNCEVIEITPDSCMISTPHATISTIQKSTDAPSSSWTAIGVFALVLCLICGVLYKRNKETETFSAAAKHNQFNNVP